MIGTFDYIAPEQIEAAAEVDWRADIYALGIMTFEVLTGKLPFGSGHPGALVLAHLTAPPPDPRDFVPDLSPATSEAIRRVMAKRPEDRFATGREFVEALG
jgi:serine/threonine-protein kinase